MAAGHPNVPPYDVRLDKYGQPWDVQWRDDEWKCATRGASNRRKFCLSIGWTIKVRFGIWMIGSNPYIQRTYKRRHPKAIVKRSSKGSLFYVIDGTELNRISTSIGWTMDGSVLPGPLCTSTVFLFLCWPRLCIRPKIECESCHSLKQHGLAI